MKLKMKKRFKCARTSTKSTLCTKSCIYTAKNFKISLKKSKRDTPWWKQQLSRLILDQELITIQSLALSSEQVKSMLTVKISQFWLHLVGLIHSSSARFSPTLQSSMCNLYKTWKIPQAVPNTYVANLNNYTNQLVQIYQSTCHAPAHCQK